jgi:hypothetical protein
VFYLFGVPEILSYLPQNHPALSYPTFNLFITFDCCGTIHDDMEIHLNLIKDAKSVNAQVMGIENGCT